MTATAMPTYIIMAKRTFENLGCIMCGQTHGPLYTSAKTERHGKPIVIHYLGGEEVDADLLVDVSEVEPNRTSYPIRLPDGTEESADLILINATNEVLG